jgi:hypothetical protein
MPQVPVVNAPSVTPAGLPGVRMETPYHLGTYAAQAGREMSELGGGMLRAGEEMLDQQIRQQDDLNQAAAKDYDTKLMGGIQAVLYGTPDNPETGFLASKGKSAVDAFDATSQKLQGLGEQLSKDLQNPAQQQLVKATTAQRVQAALVQAAQHRDQQSDVYQKAASDVRVKTAQESAPLSFNPMSDAPLASADPNAPGGGTPYQQYLQTIISETHDQAARQGLPADVAQDLVKNALGRAYTLTLGHLIDRKGGNPGDLAVAKTYFDQVKDEMPAEAQDKVRALLEAGMTKDQALSLALDVKGRISGIDAQEKELDAQYKAGKITPDVHDMALQKLRADNAQRRSEQSENDKAMLGNVWDLAQKGGSITDLSPSQYNYIKQRGLGPSVDAMFKRADQADFDDSRAYVDTMRLASEDPAAFSRMDLATLSGQLTKQHWNHLVGIQASINRQDANAQDLLKIQSTAVGDTKAQMLSAGMNLSPKPDTPAAKTLDQFTASLHDALAAAQPDWQAKKLTRAQMREEARKVTLGMLKDQALSGSGYFGTSVGQTHLPVWKMSAEQRAAPWDIPAADRQQITQALQRAGKPITEDAIQSVYKNAQGVR